MKAVSTISPASAISRATSPTRRIFSIRSASVKPRSRLRPWRTLSPSSRKVCRPRAASFFSTRLAMVDLPAPDRPVNHSTAGFWPLSAAWVSRLTSRCWRWMLSDRRSAKWSIPQATVALVSLSIRMKPPSALLGLDAFDRIRLEHDLAVGRDLGDADRVEPERRRREMLERVDVDLVFGLLDGRGDGLGAELQPIAAARAAAPPPPSTRSSLRTGRRLRADRPRPRSRRRASNRPRRRGSASPTGRRPLRRGRRPCVTIALDPRRSGPTAGSAPRRPAPSLPDAIWPGKAAEILVGPVDPLHRHPERLGGVGGDVERDGVEMLEQASARRTTASPRCGS